MSRIARRRILITGAASGMGRLMAQRFAELDAQLLLVDRDAEALEGVADEIYGAEAFTADVTMPADVDRLRSEVEAVDILINNAGVAGTGSYLEMDASDEARIMEVNMVGVHLVTKAFLPHLIASEEGHLVMMSSAAGLIGIPYQALYSGTKWFVAGLGESLRRELRSEGHRHVHVTIVCPSVVDTGFFERPVTPTLVPSLRPEKVVDRITTAILRNRPYVREPFMIRLIPLLKGMLPTRMVDALGRLLGMHRIVKRAPMVSAGREDAA